MDYPSLNNHSTYISHSFTEKWCLVRKNGWSSSQPKKTVRDFPRGSIVLWQKCFIYTSHSIKQNIQKTATQGLKFNKLMTFTAACQCRRCKRLGFNPWVGKIPWSREWQPTPIFFTRKFRRQRSLATGLQRVAHDWATEQTAQPCFIKDILKWNWLFFLFFS